MVQRIMAAAVLAGFFWTLPSLAQAPAGAAAYRVTIVLYPGDDPAAVARRLAAMYRGTVETAVDGNGSFTISLSEAGAGLMRRDPVVATMDAPSLAPPVPPNTASGNAAVPAAPGMVQTHATTNWSLGPYQYDGSGNIRAIGSDFYVYDKLGRVVVLADASPSTPVVHKQTYTYDPYGNLSSINTAGRGLTTLAMTGMSNRLSTVGNGSVSAPVGYDGAGNFVSYLGATYEYDALNVMRKSVAGGVTRSYVYTANDERIGTIEESGSGVRSEWTIRDPGGQVLRRFSRESNGEWKWQEDYIYRGSQMLAAEVPDSAKTRHFHLDHLGTPRLITGNGGAEVSRHTYHPFGEEIAPGAGAREKKQFTGHERDSESLDYMHARFYAPFMGRFLSVDPNAFWELQQGSDEDRAKFRDYLRHPQRWNRYAYVSSNPINKIDPDGREENFYMEQLFREQQMVGDGQMTEDQYWARRRSEGYGVMLGTAGAGGYLLGARAITMGYTAFQAWRAASATAATIKAIQSVSGTDARIYQSAMNMARGGGNTFMNNLTALSQALEQVVPGGKISAIGKIGDQVVYGSARTRIGITVIDGVTKVVRRTDDGKWQILGNFR